MTRLLTFAVCCIALTVLAVAPALAGQLGTASITASPNPAAANGARVDLSGCGYDVKPAEVWVVHSAGYSERFFIGVWSPGCLDTAYFLTREPGTYTINVYQKSGTKRRATNVLKASTTLTVV